MVCCRSFRTTLSFLLLLLFPFLVSCGPKKSALNVVLITIDTLRADHLGCYGFEQARTPVLDGLASDGVLFERAYAQVPITLPSHASILTGLLPPTHGIRLNGPYFLPPEMETLATMLKREKYSTAAFVSSFVLDSQFGLDRDFDVYDDLFTGGPRLNTPDRPAGATADKAAAWLRDAKPPFFLWTHFFDPHSPCAPPEPFLSDFKDNLYDGEVAYTDSMLKKILDVLEERKLSGTTLVIVTADHGEGLGEHGEATHSLFLYDSTLHVPLIIRCPETARRPAPWKPGTRVNTPVETVDLVPTVLDLLGLKARTTFDGVSLLAGARPEDRTLYAETWYPLSFNWSPLQSVRSRNWKYIRAPKPELYDTLADKEEVHNRFGEDEIMSDELASRLPSFARRQDAAASNRKTVSPEDLEKIRSLGYLSGAAALSDDDRVFQLPDPKDRIEVFDKVGEARLLTDKGEGDSAIRLLEPLAAGEQDNAVLLSVLGKAYSAQRRYTNAIACMERACELDPDNAENTIILAGTYLANGEPVKAAPILEACVAQAPNYAVAQNLLGIACGMMGGIELAVAFGQKAVELEPLNPGYVQNLAATYIRAGQQARAEALLADYFVRSGTRPYAMLYQFAEMLMGRGAHGDAVPVLEEILAQRPGDAQAQAALTKARQMASAVSP